MPGRELSHTLFNICTVPESLTPIAPRASDFTGSSERFTKRLPLTVTLSAVQT